jgi:hypothetical protein
VCSSDLLVPFLEKSILLCNQRAAQYFIKIHLNNPYNH